MAKESPEVPADKPETRVFQLGKVVGHEQKTNPFERANRHVVGMDHQSQTANVSAALKSKRLHNEIQHQLAHGQDVALDARGLQISDADMEAVEDLAAKAVRKGGKVELTVDAARQEQAFRAHGAPRKGLKLVTDAQLNRGALKDGSARVEKKAA